MTPEITSLWIKALGGPRFLLTVGNGLVCAMLLVGGFLTGSEFVAIVMGTTAVYIAARSHEKVKGVQGT